MNKARIINIIKNTSIVILSFSAVYLFLLTMNISPAGFIKGLTGGNENAVVSSRAEGLDSITTSSPYIIMLTDENGGHYAAKYDYHTKARVFSQFSVALGEALGSASVPEKISETEWRAAISEAGVFFDYLYPQPLGLIALQLGTQLPEDIAETTARRLALTAGGEEVCLYYINAATGEFFRLGTALNQGYFSMSPADTGMREGSFAFESDEELAAFDPYFVISGESLPISAAQSALPFASPSEARISQKDFSMNERTSSPFSEGSGTLGYVDVNKTLRVSSSGTVLFTATDDDGIPVSYSEDSPTLIDSIMSAASLISATISVSAGDAEIGLTGIEEGANGGGCTLTFGYYVNGIPVLLSNTGWCAKITIRNGCIVRAELAYREYSVQSEFLSVFPEKQMVIIALSKGGSPQLFYVDAGGALSAEWYNS